MSAETCPICGGGVVTRGGILMFSCGGTACQHAAEVVERLRADKAELLEACKQWISERDNPSPCWAMKQDAERKMRAAIAKSEPKP